MKPFSLVDHGITKDVFSSLAVIRDELRST